MSCGCHQSPCVCECDPANEPLASELNNFITQFFGTLTKSCVNNEVVWALPCDLAVGAEFFPRLPNEGLACYFLRYILENPIRTYGSFYALMPSDNPVAIPPGSAVAFPNDGPATGGIVRSSTSVFIMPDIATYEVNWNVMPSSVNQFILRVNSIELLNTAIGTGNTNVPMTGTFLITTTVENSTLELINPSGNVGNATIRVAPLGGQNVPFSAWLTIKKL